MRKNRKKKSYVAKAVKAPEVTAKDDNALSAPGKTAVAARRAPPETDTTPTYEESAALMKTRAREALSKLIARDWEDMMERLDRLKGDTIFIARKTQGIGEKLVRWRGAEQMAQDEFMAFMREHAGELPLGLNLAAANHCISAHHRHPEPVRELHEAVSVLTQQTFFATGLLAEPSRREGQSAVADAPFQQFMRPVAVLREWLGKYKDDLDQVFTQASDWKTFLDETEEIEMLRRTAKQRLGM